MMKRTALMMLAVSMLVSVSTFATDGGKKKKSACQKETACANKEKSCCKKPAKAALLKAKAKTEVKKAA